MHSPTRHPRSRLSDLLALWLIGLYQRWVSPYKGFRCAHAVLHGGPGCSGFAKRAIREHGFWRAIAHIRQRFRDCRAAMLALAAQTEAPQDSDGANTPRDEQFYENEKKYKDRCMNCAENSLFGCTAPSNCASCTSFKGSAAGGAAAGAEATTGICGTTLGAAGEAAGGICGAVSCCG